VILDIWVHLGIFTYVKNVRILAVFLVFVFTMPLVFTSIARLSDTSVNYVLFEYPADEVQSGERESNTKEEMDDIDEFMLHNQLDLAITGAIDFEYYERSKEFVNISTDILTPPPKFI